MYQSLSLYTDGGARGNPGPAGIGGVLRDGDQVVAEYSHYLGEATNNVAEYQGLIQGLTLARGKTARLACYLDSQLIVRQLKGEYKVKQPHLRRLVEQVRQLESNFETVTYTHISRDRNAQADSLVNQALDKASNF